ncbi:MAG: hypothetical protein JRI97_02280 [Deltaproteobacteria bacterium]|nr:hypothetical protein [Deltaproteobacteria bacterium]
MKTCMALLAALAVFLAFAPLSPAIDTKPAAVARFADEKAVTGGTVDLVLALTLPRGAELPDPPQVQGLGDIQVVDMKKTDTGLVLTLLVDSLETFRVPGLTIPYLDAVGRQGTVQSQPVSLSVDAALPPDPATEPLAPPKDVVDVGNPYRLPLIAGLAALVLAGTAFFGWRFWKRRRPQREVIPQVNPRDLYAAKLDRLARALEQGAVEDKSFYYSLSLAVREYMESLRHFPAAEMTTEEISITATAPEDREVLKMLRDADLVKFSEVRPMAAKKKEHLAQAYQYLEDTAPPPPAAGEGEAP